MSPVRLRLQLRVPWAAWVMLVACLACAWAEEAPGNTTDAALTFFAIPVGQGDCAVVVCPSGKKVLMDCGSSAEYNEAQLKNLFNSLLPLDYIVVSHPDKDHFNLIQPLGLLRGSEKVYLGGQASDYPSTFIAAIPASNLHFFPQDYWGGSLTFDFVSCGSDPVNWRVLSANHGSAHNGMSLVTRIQYGDFVALYTGDFEGTTLTNNLINVHGTTLRSTLLKVAHHGADTQANLPNLLSYVQPKFAYVSSAYPPGMYGHPRCETTARLQSYLTTLSSPHTTACYNEGTDKVEVQQLSFCYWGLSPLLSGTNVVQRFYTFTASTSGTYLPYTYKEWTTPQARQVQLQLNGEGPLGP